MIDHTMKIAIVGLGVLGGSYAQALSAKGISVIGIDTDEETVRFAKENGWIAEGGSDPAAVADADLVLCCLYPHVFVEWIKENGKYLKSGSILSDVTGVKQKIIGEINALLPEGVEFIACHPMAGRESRGIHFADASRFENANFIIVPTENNSQHAIDLAYGLAETLGFKKISCLSGQEHDQMIAFLSQLTHVIAVSLMNASDNTHLKEYTGDSFRDLTRIAKINEDMWPELFILNKENLIHEINVFVDEMNAFARLIETEDVETMKQKMIISTQRRKQFDPKEGKS